MPAKHPECKGRVGSSRLELFSLNCIRPGIHVNTVRRCDLKRGIVSPVASSMLSAAPGVALSDFNAEQPFAAARLFATLALVARPAYFCLSEYGEHSRRLPRGLADVSGRKVTDFTLLGCSN